MSKDALCFSADRICHHDEYYEVISKFRSTVNVKLFSAKLRGLLSNRDIFFLDIDSHDLIFVPLILLRSLWGGKGYGISVRTEYLVDDIPFKHFLHNIRTSKYFHVRVKRLLFFAIRKFSKTRIISIHKRHPLSGDMSKYVDAFVYDPQLWDLPVLKPSVKLPAEISKNFFVQENTTVLIAGSFTELRSRTELMAFLNDTEKRKSEKFHYIIAGKMDSKDELELKKLSFCTIINRFASNEELHYLLTRCDIVYCFYTTDRPSGFFGRATQLGKPIITRKNGYLNSLYNDYPYQIPVTCLDELKESYERMPKSNRNFSGYDDSARFRDLLFRNE